MKPDIFTKAYVELNRVYGPDDTIGILMEEIHFCTEDEWRNINTVIQGPLIELAKEMIALCANEEDGAYRELD